MGMNHNFMFILFLSHTHTRTQMIGGVLSTKPCTQSLSPSVMSDIVKMANPSDILILRVTLS